MSIKLRALMGVGMLTAAVALTGAASAAQINGGGSSLIAPVLRQAADCYGADLSLPSRKGSTLYSYATTIPVSTFARCASPGYTSPTTNDVQYISTGSGRGILSLYTHSSALFGDLDGVTPGVQSVWNNGTAAAGVQYGLSETALLATANAGAASIGVYNGGGTITSESVTYTFRDAYQWDPPLGANEYPVPRTLYGSLVQFPIAVAPIALAYDPIYKKVDVGGVVTSYRFNVNSAFARTNGGLSLDANAYCKILNGQITDWNHADITALNGGVSLKDPTDTGTFSVPIELVGRSDSSGTTQVTTRHLAAVCGGLAGNAFTNTDGTSTLPATLAAPGNVPTSGKFTLQRGDDGVAAYASFTAVPFTGATLVQGRLAYVGANYTLPTSANNGLPYTLFNASLKNGAGAYREPTGANATYAFSANQPPETASGLQGNFDPTQTAWGLRANPQDWVRVGTLANPTTSTAYPIVGTVNFIGYTCYASAAVADTLRTASVAGSAPGLLNYWFDDIRIDDATGVITSAGLAPLPTRWQNAIIKTFLAPVAGTTAPSTAQLNLFISTAGPGSPNSSCNAAGVVGA